MIDAYAVTVCGLEWQLLQGKHRVSAVQIKYLYIIVIAAALLLSCGAPPRALEWPATMRVAGQVQDHKGQFVAGALVELLDLGAERTRTDKEGRFVLAGVDEGVAALDGETDRVGPGLAVLRRAQPGPGVPRVIRAGDVTINLGAYQVQVRGEEIQLTPTEFGLLRALAEHLGQVLTRSEMIERGLGYHYEGLDRTVDSHIRNLRRKLADADAPSDLIETVFGVGYRLSARGHS